MTQVTAALIKALREKTGLGILDCKKALEETDGDMEKAIDALRKASALKAEKKSSRVAAEGILVMRIDSSHKKGVLLEVNCETDFVARDDSFKDFVNQLADQALSEGASSLDAFLNDAIETKRQALVQKIGENINIRSLSTMAPEAGFVYGYVHTNSRIGSLVMLSEANEDIGAGISMHVTAVSPNFLSADSIPENVLEKEREIFTAQAQSTNKPADIIAKMVEGRIKKFSAENALLDQAFVKDPETTIGKLCQKHQLNVLDFKRLEVGEGIIQEKKDFAEEVMAQLK